jgi:hypothetical protein
MGERAQMTNHKVGVHWIPVHNWRPDLDYIRHLQPRSVKIIDPDVQQISDVWQAVPGALLVLRNHPISEQHSDMQRDPVGTGERHARELHEWVGNFERQARERGLPFPMRDKIIVPGVNEVHVWSHLSQSVDYYAALCRAANQYSLRILALNLSVGWPANTGADTPPNWTPYEPVRQAILSGPHMLGFHEYFGQQGPQFYFGWWAGRIFKCPWQGPEWANRFLCAELGMARAIPSAGGGWGLDGATGWKKLVDGATYVENLRWLIQEYRKDARIFDTEIFTTDGATSHWGSFYTQELHSMLVAMAQSLESTPPPIVTPPAPPPLPPPPVEPPPPVSDTWQRALAWVEKWEGEYQNNPADIGNWTGCAVGQGVNKGTKYGISACSYPNLDIVNLTREQAREIYRRDYWVKSGADKLAWPLCLLVFDTAVLHGVGAAKSWLAEVGPNPYKFAAKRLYVYTRLRNGNVFWRGWVNRVANLLEMMA